MVIFNISNMVSLAKQYGIFEYYLPFVILFSLFYGLLTKSKVLGDKTGRLNGLIAAATALYVLAYTPVGLTLTQFFATFFTQTTVVLVTVLTFILIIGMFIPFKQNKEITDYVKYFVPVGAILAFGIFLSSGGLSIFPGIQLQIASLGLTGEDLSILALIGFTAIVIWWITKEERPRPLPQGQGQRQQGQQAQEE